MMISVCRSLSAVCLSAATLTFHLLAPANSLADNGEKPALRGVAAVVQLLGQVDDAAIQLDLLSGIHDALHGRRKEAMPAGWPAVFAKLAKSETPEIRNLAISLALIFGDPRAIVDLRKTIVAEDVSPVERRQALQWLVEYRAPDLAPVLQASIDDSVLREVAIRGLAAYDHADTPAIVLRNFASYDSDSRRAAINTLTSRPPYALALLAAIESGTVPREEVSAYNARQMLALKDETVKNRLTSVWGAIRDGKENRKKSITTYKQRLTPEVLAQGSASHGRAVFRRICEQCHSLYGRGGSVGPDLTGSNRANLDYALENILDPSAAIPRDYKLTVIQTSEGRVISGIIREQTPRTLVVQTDNERIVLDKQDIEAQTESKVSMMPENLLDNLNETQVRDLLAYLATKTQVDLPAGTAVGAGK